MMIKFPKEAAKGKRREKEERRLCIQENMSSEPEQKLAGEDKKTKDKRTGLSEKGDFISSPYYITFDPSPGCLK